MFDADTIRYALAKQLSTAHSLESNYGTVYLDAELIEAVARALRPILERRLEQAEKGGARHG